MRQPRFLGLGAALLVAAVALTACDRRAWYEGMQVSQRNQCMRLPPAEARDCEARLPDSYDDYERERRADR